MNGDHGSGSWKPSHRRIIQTHHLFGGNYLASASIFPLEIPGRMWHVPQGADCVPDWDMGNNEPGGAACGAHCRKNTNSHETLPHPALRSVEGTIQSGNHRSSSSPLRRAMVSSREQRPSGRQSSSDGSFAVAKQRRGMLAQRRCPAAPASTPSPICTSTVVVAWPTNTIVSLKIFIVSRRNGYCGPC